MNFLVFLKALVRSNLVCKIRFFGTAALLISLTLSPYLPAASTVQMTLAEMAAKSARIVVGRCLGSEPDFVLLPGGTRISVTTYRFQVEERIKGDASGIIEIRMLSTGPSRSGDLLRYRFSGIPELQAGGRYVLLLTQESRIGLTATIGLQQGCFTILPGGKANFRQRVVNGMQNAGLAISSHDAASAAGRGSHSSGPVKTGPVYLDEFITLLRELIQ